MINPILSKGDSVNHCQEGEVGFLQYVTLRDLFAGFYLTGTVFNSLTDREPSKYAEEAYKVADAMLAQGIV